MSQPPFEAYTGTEPYIFISYAHKNSDMVFPIIHDWHKLGYRIWYDEGIDPGNEWPEEVANALEGCSQFVVFVTPESVKSKNVRNEINFALNLEKDFFALHLRETDLPSGLKLRMGDIQAIMKYRMTEGMFENKIKKVLREDILDTFVSKAHKILGDDAAAALQTEEEKENLEALNKEKIAREKIQKTEEEAKKKAASGKTQTQEEHSKELKDDLISDDLGERIKKRFESGNYDKKPSKEALRSLWSDLRYTGFEIKKHIKSEINKNSNPSNINPEEFRKKEERRQEKKKLRKEIRREMRRNRPSKGIFGIPFSAIIIGLVVYFVFFNNNYNHLSKKFLDTHCPAYMKYEQKFDKVNSFENKFGKSQRKIAIEKEITNCEANTPKALKIKELGLDKMNLKQLEEYYLTKVNDKRYYKRMVKEYQKTLQKRITDKDAKEFVNDMVSDQYKNFLKKRIVENIK